MKKKLAILSVLIAGLAYAGEKEDEEFFQEAESGVKLQESVISTTGFETDLKSTTNNVVVVTSKMIEENDYQLVSDILQDIPSVNVIGDPKNPIIDMRGQGSDAVSNVQILIDGVKANILDTSHGKTPVNTVPVENIERIEVIPGGGAVLYGSGTRGGVINIITKAEAGKKGGSVSTDFSSFGGKKASVNYGDTFGNLGINLNYTKDNYRGFRDDDKLDSDYFEASMRYKITDDQNLTVKYSKYKGDGTTPRALTKDNLGDRDSNGIVGKYDELIKNNTDKDELNIKYDYKINDTFEFNVLGYYQKNDLETVNNYTSYGIYEVKNFMDYKDEKIGIKPKLKINYREKDSLILGYDYDHNTLDRYSTMKLFNNEIYDNDLTKDTHSIFALNRNQVGKFEFIQGIRYERAEYKASRKYTKGTTTTALSRNKTMDNVAAELVGNYLYSETGNVYIKGEKGYTSPAPAELVDKIDGVYVENDLKSETYMTYELGFKDYIYGSYLGGAFYFTETEDQITQEMLGGMNFRNYNIGRTRAYGLELEAEQYFGKLTLRESYALTKTEIISAQDKATEGKELANVPQNKFNIGFTYKITPQLNFTWDTIYSSKYYLNNENTGGKQNSYVVTNIAANYALKNGLTLYAGVQNLFNEKYYYSINSKGTEFDPAAERSFNAGFSYKF